MSDQPQQPSPEPAGQPEHVGPQSQQFQHSPVGARLPDRVAAGVFSTGVIVMEGPEEFVVDFIQGVQRPPRVAARVVLGPTTMTQFVAALKENLHRYEQVFGAPKPLPAPNTERRPTIQEIYQDLRLPEEVLSGSYANTVLVGHSPSEFCFDFITRFFPTAAVSARIYLSASQVPQMLGALSTSLQAHRQRQSEPKPPLAPPGA
jgi:hypothetical protein